MSSLISLIWLFTPSLCSFTSLIVDITVQCFFEIKFWDFSISSNLFLRSRRLALRESISLQISFRILGRNYFSHSSFKLSTAKLMLWVKFCTVNLLNSVWLNSPRVKLTLHPPSWSSLPNSERQAGLRAVHRLVFKLPK